MIVSLGVTCEELVSSAQRGEPEASTNVPGMGVLRRQKPLLTSPGRVAEMEIRQATAGAALPEPVREAVNTPAPPPPPAEAGALGDAD